MKYVVLREDCHPKNPLKQTTTLVVLTISIGKRNAPVKIIMTIMMMIIRTAKVEANLTTKARKERHMVRFVSKNQNET